jgi:hypothetical protein
MLTALRVPEADGGGITISKPPEIYRSMIHQAPYDEMERLIKVTRSSFTNL